MTRTLTLFLAAAVLAAHPARAGYDGDWGTIIGGDAGTAVVAALEADGSGNLYVAGPFSGTISVADGPALTAAGGNDVFLAKLTPTGTHIWSVRGGGDGTELVQDLAVTPSGLAVVVGITSSETFAFGGAAISTAGQEDGFAAVFFSDGTTHWTRAYGGELDDRATSAGFDATNHVYVAGQFTDRADFGTGVMTSAGDLDVFLVRSTFNSAVTDVAAYGGAGVDQAAHIDVGASGDIALALGSDGTIDLGNGPLSTFGSGDVVVATLPSVGSAASWSAAYGGASFDEPRAIGTDADGNVYVVGSFRLSANFGTGSHTSAGNGDGFLAAYKGSGGAPLWSRRFGGTENEFADAIVWDGRRIFVAGRSPASPTSAPSS